MLEFAAPEIGEVISGRKFFKTAANSLESELWENSWVTVVNRKESLQQNLQNKPVAREETNLQTFLVDHVKQILVPSFFAVSGIFGGKFPIVDDVPSSHEQEIYPTTSVNENCIKFEF